jgi:hypothetical protein
MNKELIEQWKSVYFLAQEIDSMADKGGADWESLCVGWCLAKGLSVEEAYDFYQAMITLKLF